MAQRLKKKGRQNAERGALYVSDVNSVKPIVVPKSRQKKRNPEGLRGIRPCCRDEEEKLLIADKWLDQQSA